MFDMIVKFMMGLIFVGIITYVGVVIMGKMSETANVTEGDKFYSLTTTMDTTIEDGVGWVSIIIVALAAVMIFTVLFGVFGYGR